MQGANITPVFVLSLMFGLNITIGANHIKMRIYDVTWGNGVQD